MNKNIKIVVKVVIVCAILFHLPLQKVYSEKTQSVLSHDTLTNIPKTSNGKSIHIYNTHQGEKYATQSVK